ncbi:MAG TPA: hypothetical protein VF466_00310 [Candidatus Saccharimonadales bacterium]
MADITKPKKRDASAAVPAGPKLVIPKRSIIPVSDGSDPAPVPAVPPKPVGKSVEPSSADLPSPTPAVAAAKSAAEPEAEETDAPAPAAVDNDHAVNDKPETSEAADTPGDTDATSDASDAIDADDKSGRPSPHVKKLLEDAKREEEIQKYIDNREFFVPINAVAHKRSIKVSSVLVFVELVLGLVLLDLMLDSGLIDLVQKIPHTHFFGLH